MKTKTKKKELARFHCLSLDTCGGRTLLSIKKHRYQMHRGEKDVKFAACSQDETCHICQQYRGK